MEKWLGDVFSSEEAVLSVWQKKVVLGVEFEAVGDDAFAELYYDVKNIFI